MKELEKMLAKKMGMSKNEDDGGDSEMPDHQAQAKEAVLQELIEMMQSLRANKFGDDFGEMKKVSVMSPDTEGLEEGLDKAKDVIGDMGEEESEDDSTEITPILAEDEEEDEGYNPMAKMKRKGMLG